MAIPSNGDELISLFEYFLQDTLPTLLAIIAVAAYSGFVFMFYRLLARRDILTLDLGRYEDSMSGRIRAFFRTLVFMIQYVIAIPLLISFWTVVMAVILTLLSDGSDHARNALIATSVIGGVRIVSYWTEDLSRDVAKMLPFAVLGVFLVDSKATIKFSEFEDLFNNLPELGNSYINSLILLSIIETLLRIGSSTRELWLGSRKVKKKLKKIANETGRSTANIREDILDDGVLNFSTKDESDTP